MRTALWAMCQRGWKRCWFPENRKRKLWFLIKNLILRDKVPSAGVSGKVNLPVNVTEIIDKMANYYSTTQESNAKLLNGQIKRHRPGDRENTALGVQSDHVLKYLTFPPSPTLGPNVPFLLFHWWTLLQDGGLACLDHIGDICGAYPNCSYREKKRRGVSGPICSGSRLQFAASGSRPVGSTHGPDWTSPFQQRCLARLTQKGPTWTRPVSTIQ